MDKLSDALGYAAIGWPVFPCDHEKKPKVLYGVHSATTDEALIHEWWGKWPDANIGFSPGAAGLMVLDQDPGFDGDYEIPDTGLVVSTPRGGKHYYYKLNDEEIVPPSVSRLAPHLDVRSNSSYVLLPPSTLPEGDYSWSEGGAASLRTDKLFTDATITYRPATEERHVWKVEPDLPHNIEKAITWLQNSARVAISGAGGDATAYATAAHCRSFALSETVTSDLMWKHWNPRCLPPWSEDEREHLETKIANAYSYATSPPGNITEEYIAQEKRRLFTPKPDMDNVVVRTNQGDGQVWEYGRFRLRNRAAIEDIPKQNWILRGFLPEDSYAILYAPPQYFKTFMALDISLSIATGWPAFPAVFTSEEINPGPVIYMTGEGLGGISKRVKAWENIHAYGNQISHFYLFDPTPHISDNNDDLVAFIQHTGITPRLIVLDTISRVMQGVSENDQAQASAVTKLADSLRGVASGCSVLALHHANKDGSMRGSTVYEGDADVVLHAENKRIVEKEDGHEWLVDLVPKKLKDAPVDMTARTYVFHEKEVEGAGMTLVAMPSPSATADADVSKMDASFSKEHQEGKWTDQRRQLFSPQTMEEPQHNKESPKNERLPDSQTASRLRSDALASRKVIEAKAIEVLDSTVGRAWTANSLSVAIAHSIEGLSMSSIRRHLNAMKVDHNGEIHERYDPITNRFK